MTKERELLRRALDYIDQYDSQGLELYGEIETYLSTPSDDAEEPVAWMFETDRGPHYFRTEKDALRGASLYGNYVFKPLYLHPPKPAEPEAEPVGEIDAFIYEDETLYLRETIDLNSRFDELLGQKLYIHPPKVAEPARKPMTEEEILELYNQCEEETSVHSTIFHFDKFARAIEARGIVLRPLNKKQIEKAFEDTGYAKGDSRGACFVAGIRFAEKHHGIGGGDE